MSKKVLLISSSPRIGGNSDILCDQFAKGAAEAGAEVEKIVLKEKEIHYCTGCGLCVQRKGSCSQKDDMSQIAQKMLEADVWVLATPVYFYTMSAQMKTLIDRCCAFYTEMQNKEIYFIVTAADDGIADMQRTIEGFRGFTVCLNNPIERGIIYGVGAWEKGTIKTKKSMQEAYEAGKAV